MINSREKEQKIFEISFIGNFNDSRKELTGLNSFNYNTKHKSLTDSRTTSVNTEPFHETDEKSNLTYKEDKSKEENFYNFLPDSKINSISTEPFYGTNGGTNKENSTKGENFYTLSQGPKIIGKFYPKYPLSARKMKKSGKVKMEVFIDENGKLLSFSIVESTGKEFEKSVEEELKKVTFYPAFVNGIAVKSKGILSVRFEINDNI
ncbi:MAG: energy transducer TonB [Elusimicrobiota bacterium]